MSPLRLAALPALSLLVMAGCPRPARPPAPAPPPQPLLSGPLRQDPDDAGLPDGDCRCWSGQIAGNDADVRSTIRLCRAGPRVSGIVRWSSPRSGRSARAVSGELRGETLLLRDQRMLQNQPRPTWRFCLVDQYRLHLDRQSGLLAGSYQSPACQDSAQLRFRPAARVRCLLSIWRGEELP